MFSTRFSNMRLARTLTGTLAIAVCAVLPACATAPANCVPAATTVSSAPQDASLRQQIVGSWVVPRDSGDYRPEPAREEYRTDGTYTLYYYDSPACKNVIGQIDATWQIEQGILVSVITHISGNRQMGSLGDVSREQIVTMDGNKMVLHSLNNQLFKFLDTGGTYARQKLDQKSDTCLAG